MREDEVCRKIVLAGGEGCQIVYCEGCQVVEVQLGAISVHLELTALHNLQSILGQAAIKLSVLKAIKVSPEFHYDQFNLE
ncbi:MAG: hypothetical protein PSV17_10950 [Methylotenera sp.]|uniref:hypothetical protein n=1 Tax=Methylotenera sp. TaxID=2051956 RepID=UPI0024875513|nr:hypothetical protein [Methylotenera sp.]MDI1309931.1 hypothetical protein [Methylotenera sp.]